MAVLTPRSVIWHPTGYEIQIPITDSTHQVWFQVTSLGSFKTTLESHRDAVKGLQLDTPLGRGRTCHQLGDPSAGTPAGLGFSMLFPPAGRGPGRGTSVSHRCSGKTSGPQGLPEKAQWKWWDLKPLPWLFQLDPRNVPLSGQGSNKPALSGCLVFCLSLWQVVDWGKLHRVWHACTPRTAFKVFVS